MRYHFTDAEVAELQLAADVAEIQPTYPPPLIRGVMNTQLSIARFSGGITFNSHHFTYFPAGDELIRDDVLQRVTKARQAAEKARKLADATKVAAAQGALL
jgi:hypothetical protein